MKVQVLDEICALLESHKGRDKVLRTLCYSTRLIGGLSANEELCKKLIFFSKQMSLTRTTLRLFDDFPMIQYSLEYGLGKNEPTKFLSFLGVLSNIIDQSYYPIEKICWLAEHRLLTSVNKDKWDTLSSVSWVLSTYLSLFRNLQHLYILNKHIKEVKAQKVGSPSLDKLLLKQSFDILTCVRLSLDLTHAISTLPPGYLWSSKLNTWQVGLIGTLSSVLGLYQFLAKRNL